VSFLHPWLLEAKPGMSSGLALEIAQSWPGNAVRGEELETRED